MNHTTGLPQPVAAAAREGHTLEYDATHRLPWLRRWVCTTCDAIVAVSGSRIYGSATERTCAEYYARWGGSR